MDNFSFVNFISNKKIDIKSEYVIFKNDSINYDINIINDAIIYMKNHDIKLFAFNNGLCINNGLLNVFDGYINIDLYCFIIHKSLIKDICAINEEVFITKLLLLNNNFYQSDINICKYNSVADMFLNTRLRKSWYNKDVDLLKEFYDLGIDNIILNIVIMYYQANIASINSILDDKELKLFEKKIIDILNHIDDKYFSFDVINKNYRYNKDIIYYLINLKYKDLKYEIKNNYVSFNGNKCRKAR